MWRWIILSFTHLVTLVFGFALGIYLLPILTAPESIDRGMLNQAAQSASYSADFKRDLKGSDFLHWGEGKVSLSPQKVVHVGKIAPGPDYKLYLVPKYVENEDEFLKVKTKSQVVGDVKNFDGFLLNIPEGVDIENYNTVLVV